MVRWPKGQVQVVIRSGSQPVRRSGVQLFHVAGGVELGVHCSEYQVHVDTDRCQMRRCLFIQVLSCEGAEVVRKILGFKVPRFSGAQVR